MLPEKEEPLSGDAEWEVERISGDGTEFADLFYVCAGWTFSAGRFEFCERFSLTSGSELNIPIRLIPYPSGEPELARCLHYVPAKPDTLHTSPNLEMYALHRPSSGEFPIAPPASPRLSTGL